MIDPAHILDCLTDDERDPCPVESLVKGLHLTEAEVLGVLRGLSEAREVPGGWVRTYPEPVKVKEVKARQQELFA
jgi:hypothetical protein